MSASPRKTRSVSRRLSDTALHSVEHRSPLPAQGPFLAINRIPVMNASSMVPVRDRQPGYEKRVRHKMTEVQLQRLEELYRENTHPSRQAKEDIARETGMLPKTVLIWFQNRRQDRRRRKKATPQQHAADSERNPAQKGRRPPAEHAKPKPAPAQRRKKARAADPDMPTTPAPHAAPVQDARGQPSPPSAHTVSSHAGDSMDVDVDGSPSTAPTSVHAQPMLLPYLPRIARSPSSSLDSSSSGASPSSPHALWRLVVTSPPPPPPFSSSSPSSLPAPSRRPFGNLQSHGAQRSLNAAAATPTQPDLEWACANSAARRKHGRYAYRDEDDSEGESSSGLSEGRHRGRPRPIAGTGTRLPADAAESNPGPRVRRRWQQRHGGDSAAAAVVADKNPANGKDRRAGHAHASDVGVVAVPREYDLLFPPDMVLGAALLLTLKHS
ncbi:hypothetical protein BC628DRAFT_1416058 [Trametes gibbosa]|nr:hypothetical protein BC628DRAFT_1416058 [Trametes gibbosa]